MKSLRVYLQYSQHRRLIGLVITVYLEFQQVFYYESWSTSRFVKTSLIDSIRSVINCAVAASSPFSKLTGVGYVLIQSLENPSRKKYAMLSTS